MVKQNVRVNAAFGIHFRPAGKITESALKYVCDIKIIFGNKETNIKSFLNLLAACIKKDDEIELICDGPDENQALEEMAKLIESDFLE